MRSLYLISHVTQEIPSTVNLKDWFHLPFEHAYYLPKQSISTLKSWQSHKTLPYIEWRPVYL